MILLNCTAVKNPKFSVRTIIFLSFLFPSLSTFNHTTFLGRCSCVVAVSGSGGASEVSTKARAVVSGRSIEAACSTIEMSERDGVLLAERAFGANGVGVADGMFCVGWDDLNWADGLRRGFEVEAVVVVLSERVLGLSEGEADACRW